MFDRGFLGEVIGVVSPNHYLPTALGYCYFHISDISILSWTTTNHGESRISVMVIVVAAVKTNGRSCLESASAWVRKSKHACATSHPLEVIASYS